MRTALSTLTARLTAVARRNADTYLPWSPLSGIGRAGELAAQHPAFAPTAEPAPRHDA
ncbi:hypothetical protein [Geodermatophilus ruber]|uniref:Uncharacterized protein n=1 Tax=Geodermatophilus ruber TaxID=504800 RepID=A0A1I4F9V7_9ACTN|nr:hypothetical protein [Geodermatophilus ruber]SFL13657.1 hypothetical protein SAMN04488085_10711 [Geodermatophilus ruber]